MGVLGLMTRSVWEVGSGAGSGAGAAVGSGGPGTYGGLPGTGTRMGVVGST